MSVPPFQVRYNPMRLNTISAFAHVNGSYRQHIKDVCFVRLIGCKNQHAFLHDLRHMDEAMTQHPGKYLRLLQFPDLPQPDQLAYYAQHWDCEGKQLHYETPDMLLQTAITQRLQQLPQQYHTYYPNTNHSMMKNFMVKILFWADMFFPSLFTNWEICRSPKFVCSGTLKKQAYFFLYFLTQLGVDVLYLNPEKDLALEPSLLKLSALYDAQHYEAFSLPAPADFPPKDRDNKPAEQKAAATPAAQQPIRVQIPAKHMPQRANDTSRQEKSFEELAALASSVVMIEVLDSQGQCFKTGSGIIISHKGYILTNFHVVCDSSDYLIKLEGDEQSYPCQEMIKYNYVHDLALLHIERACTPLTVYQSDKPLIRGQKVVAIGSPLGLFNSVSDGIISGFRTMQDTDMIQFTAPTSPGSSGGALLNMQGDVIGMCTAGIHDGQNINLAVNFQTILPFISGFLLQTTN